MDIVDEIINSLEFKFFSKKISHTIMLVSKDNFYSLEFAKVLASFIIDGKVDKNSENYKKIMLLSHPDVKYYPSKEKLLVGDSEEIVSESFVKPIFANKKVFIIKNIDNSMESAQNKLLKTLEEPSAEVYLILTCANQELVLPTIKSRCTIRELAKISEDQIVKFLPSSDKSTLVSKICDGELGEAIRLSKKENLEEIVQFSLDLLIKMKSSKQVLSFSKIAQKYSDDIDLILKIMCLIIEDMINFKAGNKQIKLVMFKEQIEKASVEYSIKALCMINRKINQLQKEIFYNVGIIVAFENFLLNILEVKYLCK